MIDPDELKKIIESSLESLSPLEVAPPPESEKTIEQISAEQPLDPVVPPEPEKTIEQMSAEQPLEDFDIVTISDNVRNLAETLHHVTEVTDATSSNVNVLVDKMASLVDLVAKNNQIEEQRWRKDSAVLTLIEQWLQRR